MSYDEQPNAPIHAECAIEIERLNTEMKDFKEIAGLIGSIFFFGNFKSETMAERELEMLLRRNGYFFENESQLMEKLHSE